MNSLNQTATREDFDGNGEVTHAEELSVWAVEKSPDTQPDSGIYIALNDNSGVTVTEETLAVLGYVRG